MLKKERRENFQEDLQETAVGALVIGFLRQTLGVTDHTAGTTQLYLSANGGDRVRQNTHRVDRNYGGPKVAVCATGIKLTYPIGPRLTLRRIWQCISH